MEETFYAKVGRRYVPITVYNSSWHDSYPKGCHLVMAKPGGKSTMYNIDPAYGPMIAAGKIAADAICNAIVAESKYKPSKQPVTEGQRRAWKALDEAMGDGLATLQAPGVRDCVQKGIDAMVKEADKLLSNPDVRKAWEQFLLVAELSK